MRNTLFNWGLDSVVGVATRYVLIGWDSNIPGGKNYTSFLTCAFMA
jgi:hypothetical protein